MLGHRVEVHWTPALRQCVVEVSWIAVLVNYNARSCSLRRQREAYDRVDAFFPFRTTPCLNHTLRTHQFDLPPLELIAAQREPGALRSPALTAAVHECTEPGGVSE